MSSKNAEMDVIGQDRGVSASVWRYARARRAHLVVDAAEYFDLMHKAMMAAQYRIMMIGWDFDSRIRLPGGRRWWNLPRRKRFPARLGAFMVWLVRRRPALQILLLKWNFGALRFLLRGTMIIDMIRWVFNRRIVFRFDSAHPIGCSHHQKIVVLDDGLAMCGGIDMTGDRWDTPDHVHDDPRRRRPNGRPYAPWHDVTMMLDGEAAGALGELGRMRWRQSGGRQPDPVPPSVRERSFWPESAEAEFRDVEIGIARTRTRYGGYAEVREIESLFVEHVMRAKRFIYAESQYFASRRIAEAMAARLSRHDAPEIILINPQTSAGWLEQAAMDTARARLLHAIAEHDPVYRMHVYSPFTSGGEPIYVHAKVMIVDDEVIRVGSANMNNRSMGLDSECDVFIDAARPGNDHAAEAIGRLRIRLLAEHCGCLPDQMKALLDDHASMADAIAAAPRRGKYLEAFRLRPLTDAEKAVADSALLDPERPEELFEPIRRRQGLFRRGGFLRRPE